MSKAAPWPLLALGFRPFFLLSGVAALLLMLAWLLGWHARFPAAGYYGRIAWHAHEMLFGYTAAVIAGFLLTAVRNWTGRQTASGARLAVLALWWLAGRIAPWVPGVPPVLVAVTDVTFLPLVAFSLAQVLLRAENRANLVLPLLLLWLAVANALMHLQALGVAETARTGMQLAMDGVLALLLLIGGRVMPFFIRVAVPGAEPRNRSWVEQGTVLLVVLLGLAHVAGWHGVPVAWIALGLGGLQGIRLAGWHHPGVWRIPILWVLVTGYGWLVLSLVLGALAELGGMPLSPAEHAFTAGAIGVTTLGMMARVTLGHTGRPMQPPRPMTAAFVLVNLAALFRVGGPTLWPEGYVFWILLAGTFWVAAFAIFLYRYTPMLLQPRVDGRPG